MNFLIMSLSVLVIGIVGALYVGVGWCVAWVFDAGLNVDANYKIFMIVAFAIFLVKLLIAVIGAVFTKKEQKKMDKVFKGYKW